MPSQVASNERSAIEALEEKLNEAGEFFSQGGVLTPTLQVVRDDLREMISMVDAERFRGDERLSAPV